MHSNATHGLTSTQHISAADLIGWLMLNARPRLRNGRLHNEQSPTCCFICTQTISKINYLRGCTWNHSQEISWIRLFDTDWETARARERERARTREIETGKGKEFVLGSVRERQREQAKPEWLPVVFSSRLRPSIWCSFSEMPFSSILVLFTAPST